MKILNKILIVTVVLLVSSCELTNLDHLDSPNAVTPENAELSLFFNAVQLDFEDFVYWASNRTAPLTRMTAMTGGNTYNNSFTAITYNINWDRAYARLLPDLNEIISIADDPESGIPIYAGAAKCFKAYTLMTLVDLFGDVPNSEAGQGFNIPSPKADEDATIYGEALNLINEAIADFGKDSPSIEGDLYYEGNTAAWLALANTLKLKYFITTRLVSSDAGSQIEAIKDLVILDSDNDFQFDYGTNRTNNVGNPDSRHPRYMNHYEVDGNEYLSNYFMWSLLDEKGMEDPRLRYYFYRQDCDTTDEDSFTLDCPTVPRPLHYNGPYPWCVASETGYWGRDHANNDGIPPDGDKKTCFGVYPAGGKYDNDNCAAVKNGGADGGLGQGISPILLSSFSNFMLAEAVLTLGVSGDAAAYLEAGIRQSISKVISFGSLDGDYDAAMAPTADDIDTYVNAVLDSFNGADANGKMDVVAKEYHIALFGNGIEAYNMYRRTGMPTGMQPTRDPNGGDFPRLSFYPADYVNLNANANQRDITDQVFWDTNPAGFID